MKDIVQVFWDFPEPFMRSSNLISSYNRKHSPQHSKSNLDVCCQKFPSGFVITFDAIASGERFTAVVTYEGSFHWYQDC